MKANLAIMQPLQVQIHGIETTFSQHFCRDKVYRFLCSVADIGLILAIVILLETGDIGDFAVVGNYASYYRCLGSAHMSNGKKNGECNSSNGNRSLAWAYVEATNFAIDYREVIRKFYQRKRSKRNGFVAIKANGP